MTETHQEQLQWLAELETEELEKAIIPVQGHGESEGFEKIQVVKP